MDMQDADSAMKAVDATKAAASNLGAGSTGAGMPELPSGSAPELPVVIPSVAPPAPTSGGSPAGEDAAPEGDFHTESPAAQVGQGGTTHVGVGSPFSALSSQGIALAQGSDEGSAGKDVAKAGATTAAAAGASQALTLMAILNYLRLLMAMVQAMVSNLFSMVVAMVMQFVASAASFVVGIGAAVGQAIGVSALVGAFGAVGTGAVILVVALSFLFGGSDVNPASSATVVLSCTTNTEQVAADTSADPTGTEAERLTNAKAVYSVLAAWGMPDANIAGILGNWQAESNIDATSVQGDVSSPFAITESKRDEAEVIANGIGLGQWTGDRNVNLRAFATATAGGRWWTVPNQLAFLISDQEGANADVVLRMVGTSLGTPAGAALYFHDQWERSSDTEEMKQRRADYAREWFALMSGWVADAKLANSVLAQSGMTGDAADALQVSVARDNCRDLNTTNVLLVDGGLTEADAQVLVDLYNAEGDVFLDGRYGQHGGPGSCGTDHAMNCVSMSTYFLNKYTTFQHYPPGNGIRTAASVAIYLDRELVTAPVAYSIGSGPGSGTAGHTLVVLGVDGDRVIVAEAAYCAFGGRVSVRSAATMIAQGWVFTEINDIMLPDGEAKTS